MFQSRCFTYTWSVSILSFFQYQKAGRGLLNLKTVHWNTIWVIINKFPTAIPVFSSFIFDGEFGFKYFLNYTWNDYNGLVWGQEANPVANKSEYIREGYALRKSLKGLKYKKKKKKTECFAKFIKRIKRSLKNVQLQLFV